MVFTPFTVLMDWNPQFFREVKGRLTVRNTGLAIATSCITQSVLMLGFGSLLPNRQSSSNSYCTGEIVSYNLPACLHNASGYPLIDWASWWMGVFQALTGMLVLVGLIAGVYLLMSDLAQEEQRGTLNFIRLSPQPSQRILWGKLLGVPILPYVAIATAIPLHLYAGLQAGVSVPQMACLYIAVLMLSALCFTSALLLVNLGVRQASLGVLAICLASPIIYGVGGNILHSPAYLPIEQWFTIPIGRSLMRSTVWWVVTMGVATYWVWVALNRHFCNPNALLLSKRQSYVMTAGFEVWLLGLMTQSIEDEHSALAYGALFMVVNIFWLMVLAAVIIPPRQALLDWARYRRVQHSAAARSSRLLQDLLYNDKSPAILALGANLAIALGGLAVWLLRWPALETRYVIVMGTITLSLMFVVICTLVVQVIIFSQAKFKVGLAWMVMSSLIFLLPLGFLVSSAFPDKFPLLWLFSAFGLAAIESVSIPMLVLASLGQLAALLLGSAQLARQVRKAGESESQALLSDREAKSKLICK